ncbi:ParB/RepB/Spo0J family partition protein [Tunturiibacter gelidoferens]|uniref:ParB family chromosome partitioning protein n=1 Tax=Tunturiibacter lichenicola TaxID=2051959 RepID=A0A7Y9NRJ7_9BACT|nr:chromosome partitioning protein ParB [Edaphobacter lichenicola]NYF53600.1 ParB family chromosome partitioning protein [Edaphobacter lichenicola]
MRFQDSSVRCSVLESSDGARAGSDLQRSDVHPMEEASGFRALLDLEESKYSIEQISAKTGKSPVYVASRLKLTELTQNVVDAFYREEIGVGHALLLAKLQPDQQEQALAACFKEDWSTGGQKAKRILLPVRSLQFWIESNILLVLKLAPFDKRDAQLVPAAGSCVDCPKRTGHNKLLFSDLGKLDACTAPGCYQAKVEAHVAKAIAAKPTLVQINTAHGQQKEGSVTLPRNRYTEIRADKPANKEQAARPEFKTCKYTTEAIVSEGIDKGELRKVCTEPTCPVHHPKSRAQKVADDPKWKAEQEKQRRETAIANTTGIRTLAAITAAVPVGLLKRDLLFVAERLASLLDENRLAIVAKQYGIRKAKDSDSLGKLFAAYLRRAEESVLGKVLVETTILYMATRHNPSQVLHDAAAVYKVDTDAIALKVKQEFAAKEKTQTAKKAVAKSQTKAVKKAKAA